MFLNQYLANNITRIETTSLQNDLERKNIKNSDSKKKVRKLDMNIQNSINIFNLLDKKIVRADDSLVYNESDQLKGSKDSILKNNDQELNKMFTKLEISQSVVFENQKNIEDIVKEEPDNFYCTQKTLFQKIFRKSAKSLHVNTQLTENFIKMSKIEILKLKDDEISEKINNQKIFYLVNLWQNLSLKERFLFY